MSSSRLATVLFLAPAVLWSAHFLFVYVFVSLACLWGWAGMAMMGIGLVTVVVTAVTAGTVLVIGLIAAGAWRTMPEATADPTATALRRRRFLAQATAAQGALFAFSTLIVGLPPLMRPPCV